MPAITGKVAIVTGAGRGIGLELTRQLAAKGNTIYATARRPDSAKELLKLAETSNVIVTKLDVSSPSSITDWARDIASKTQHVDLLINNAGILENTGLDGVSWDEMSRLMETNAFGPLFVVQALHRHRLLGGSAGNSLVVNMTSKMGSVSDNGMGSYYSYRASKAALNIITKSLSIDLAGQGISAVVLHPGFVKTDMVNGMGNIDAATSAAGLIRQMEKGNKAINGKFLGWNDECIPW